MTPEQKAEAYEMALEKAKDALNDGTISSNAIAYLQDIFPELKESEDEQTRKALIILLQHFCKGYRVDGLKFTVSYEEMLAWVEKRNKPINEEKILIGARKDVALSIMNFLDKNTTSMCLSNMECEDLEDAVIDSDWARVYFYMKKKLEKQVEQKFHEGDWVILSSVGEKDKLVQVEIVEYFPNGQPRYITTDGKWFDSGSNAHLWTIKDAKDGDVIITKNKNIFIFKLIRDCTIYDYCGLYFGKFIEFSSAVNGRLAAKLPTNYAPATKEQRDTLMKAMTDAGYTFDFEKKELKKIEQKSEPKFKVGDWIIFNNNSDAHRVEKIEDGVYTLSNSIGGKMVLSSVLDKLIRHWTIKDAEDGDVLVTIDDEHPFIYKGCLDTNHPDSPVAYCGIDSEDCFICSCIDKFNNWRTGEKVLPATKEQHSLLFEKMKKAGYEWDAEKKKLKKIKK